MSWWSTVDLTIKALSSNATKQIDEIDFSEFGFSEPLKQDNTYRFSETEFEYFEENLDTEDSGPYYVMRLIEKALGPDGKAVMVLKDTEFEAEYHVCIVYYYLGDKIRTRYFQDMETEIYEFNGFMSALLDMSDDEIGGIYKEMFDGKDEDYDERAEYMWLKTGRYHQAYRVAKTLGFYDYYGLKREITKYYNGPKVLALFEKVDELNEKCLLSESEIESGDFIPDLSWEETYNVKYSAEEKGMLD